MVLFDVIELVFPVTMAGMFIMNLAYLYLYTKYEKQLIRLKIAGRDHVLLYVLKKRFMKASDDDVVKEGIKLHKILIYTVILNIVFLATGTAIIAK